LVKMRIMMKHLCIRCTYPNRLKWDWPKWLMRNMNCSALNISRCVVKMVSQVKMTKRWCS
jgi:GldJ_short: gliding motility-associated lipoprotein GldJ